MLKQKHYFNIKNGFTLVELTIVLVIVSLLMGGMLVSLGTQRDVTDTSETQKRLSEMRDALIGFTVANGRLPCPATPGTTGIENPSTGVGPCNNPYDGFLPGITLGIGPLDGQGYAVDSWGNRIRYAVTEANAFAFTTTNGIKTNWAGGLLPNLIICNTSVGISATSCPAASQLSTNAVALILSYGKNGPSGQHGDDELANTNPDRVFVSHTQSPSGAAQGEFDDVITWISPNILFNRMISAGRLP
ncbi:MAG: type II secretion system protein [Betaproteobacteria bacterium]